MRRQYWVIRDDNGRCVYGILEINETKAWQALARQILAIHGITNTIDEIKEWSVYRSEKIELDDMHWKGQAK